MLEFNSSVLGGELPIGLGVVGIAVVLPGGDFIDEGLFVGDAAVEALGRKDPEFGLRQIEPAAVLWRGVPFEALDQPLVPGDDEERDDFIRAVTAGVNDLEGGREISFGDAAIRLGLDRGEAPP